MRIALRAVPIAQSTATPSARISGGMGSPDVAVRVTLTAKGVPQVCVSVGLDAQAKTSE